VSASRLARVAWSDESGAVGVALRTALLPASALFRLGAAVHHGLYDAGIRRVHEAALPVISVGNLRVGGAGKTPFTAWVVDRLVENGRRPAVLHGGYGSDEPALHRRWHPDAPVLVGRERLDSVAAAAAAGADVAVLDDGFQHRRLARDLDIVLLAAEHGVERIRLLPRGPWREPLGALRRAGAIVVTRKTASAERASEVAAKVHALTERRALRAWIRPAGWSRIDGTPAEAPAGPVTAVASIAEPESFFRTLEAQGVPIARRLPFPDHHEFTEAEARRILLASPGGMIVMTE
jgi:tetraacyldisaccharide 4'-kinase